ncbi:MAG: PEP-CTERM sorting domain-containing protein [Phenylobacterium sp.]|nr:MAG: PEP-CTERM sorting domain-containing protein [Phenylobacterium sp.]
MTIDLFIDQAFTTGDDRRIAGFWGTTFGGPDAPAYPIIELDRVGGDLVFRGWDNNGVFFDLATLTAGDVGTWQTMKIELSGANFKYTAGGASATTSAFGTSSIGNVILQAHNTGSDFTVHWDAFGTAVPEPQTWGLMILGFGAAGSLLRRRRAVAA